jgi:hypothetical protein
MMGIRVGVLLMTPFGAAAAQQQAAPPVTPAPAAREAYAIAAPVGSHFEFTHSLQPDPADSLYRVARDLLGRGDWGRAARLFKDIGAKYPKSAYEADVTYYEAAARYRIGTSDELHTAAKLLEPRATKIIAAGTTPAASNSFSPRRNTQDADVVGLYVRINNALAARGDGSAAAVVAKAAQSGATCDREELSVKAEAISALTQVEPAAALPIAQRVLSTRDECSVELRKGAVFVLGRRGDSAVAGLLSSTAKSDPSVDVRVSAIGWLPKVQGDAGVKTLEDILGSDNDERIQRAVVRTLTSSDNPRARSGMRALIERKDASTSLRVEAVNAFNGDRASAEDAAFLRGLYGRVDNERVKESLITTVGRISGPENDAWLLALAKNTNEPSQMRSTAIMRLTRQNTPIADLMRLYEISDSYDARLRIVSALTSRREPEAGDKLVEIFRTTTERNIKTQILNSLSQRKDPRAPGLIQEVLEGKKP